MDPSLGVGIKHLRVPSLALEIPEFQLRCQQAINKQVVPFFFFKQNCQELLQVVRVVSLWQLMKLIVPSALCTLPHGQQHDDFSFLYIFRKKFHHLQGIVNALLPLPQMWQRRRRGCPYVQTPLLLHTTFYILMSFNFSRVQWYFLCFFYIVQLSLCLNRALSFTKRSIQ